MAIQPTIGMIAIRPWTSILPGHAGSRNAHANPSPTPPTRAGYPAQTTTARWAGLHSRPGERAFLPRDAPPPGRPADRAARDGRASWRPRLLGARPAGAPAVGRLGGGGA